MNWRFRFKRRSSTTGKPLWIYRIYDPVGNPRWFKATNTRAKLLWTPSALPDLYSRLTFNHLNARAPQSETELQPNSPRYTPERPVFQTRSASTIGTLVINSQSIGNGK